MDDRPDRISVVAFPHWLTVLAVAKCQSAEPVAAICGLTDITIEYGYDILVLNFENATPEKVSQARIHTNGHM